MAQAKMGDTVKVNYTVKLEDSTIISSTADLEPLQFTIGEGKIVPGFEQAVIGMQPGEAKSVLVPANQAFGPHLEEMIVTVDRTQFPADWKIEVGKQLQFQQEDGTVIGVMVIDVAETKVTLDANHPLAGKDLTFDIQFVEVI